MDTVLGVSTSVWQRLADPALKRRYAELLRTKPDNATGRMEAAQMLFPAPEDSFLVFQVSSQWPHDPEVIAERDRLAKITPADALPTMEQMAQEVYAIALDNTKSVDDRLKAYRLYGELRQMLGKGGPGGGGVSVNLNIDNRGVYVIPQRSTDPVAFATKAIDMQARLVAGAKSPAS